MERKLHWNCCAPQVLISIMATSIDGGSDSNDLKEGEGSFLKTYFQAGCQSPLKLPVLCNSQVFSFSQFVLQTNHKWSQTQDNTVGQHRGWRTAFLI